MVRGVTLGIGVVTLTIKKKDLFCSGGGCGGLDSAVRAREERCLLICLRW